MKYLCVCLIRGSGFTGAFIRRGVSVCSAFGWMKFCSRNEEAIDINGWSFVLLRKSTEIIVDSYNWRKWGASLCLIWFGQPNIDELWLSTHRTSSHPSYSVNTLFTATFYFISSALFLGGVNYTIQMYVTSFCEGIEIFHSNLFEVSAFFFTLFSLL